MLHENDIKWHKRLRHILSSIEHFSRKNNLPNMQKYFMSIYAIRWNNHLLGNRIIFCYYYDFKLYEFISYTKLIIMFIFWKRKQNFLIIWNSFMTVQMMYNRYNIKRLRINCGNRKKNLIIELKIKNYLFF